MLKKIINQNGFSLAEVLVALFIILIVWSASAQLFLSNLSLVEKNRNLTIATDDLKNFLEIIKEKSTIDIRSEFDFPDGKVIDPDIDGDGDGDLTLPGEQIIISFPNDPLIQNPLEIELKAVWQGNEGIIIRTIIADPIEFD